MTQTTINNIEVGTKFTHRGTKYILSAKNDAMSTAKTDNEHEYSYPFFNSQIIMIS